MNFNIIALIISEKALKDEKDIALILNYFNFEAFILIINKDNKVFIAIVIAKNNRFVDIIIN